MWLKYEPVIDLAAVAAGFVFRAIAGGVATGVPLSDWFLIVAGAGSLFVVTGKRHAEQVELGLRLARASGDPRRVLHRVPRIRAVRLVGRHDHRVLPLGLRERRTRPATPRGSDSRSCRS